LDSVARDLQYLTGPETAGRLSGTDGARLASDYLAGALGTLGLLPAGEDGYFQWLEVPAARLAGPPRLTIGGVTYQYRADFSEMAHLTAGGSVRSHLVVVNDGEEVRPEDLRGKVVLIPKRPEGFDFNATAAAVAGVGAMALLVEWGEPTGFHKTIFGSADNRIPVLRMRESLAAALAGQPGLPVELDFPFTVERLPCRNVVGLLPGTDTTRTVALTAHYDHVGDDPGGRRFPGAMDNASGVATVLAAVRRLVDRNTPLPFNLLIGFLTGEESGLWGAKHLAANPPVPLTAVINLDGMGLEPSLRAIRLGYPAPGNWLADLAAQFFQQQGTQVQWTTGGDDSVAFQAAGLPALGLGQMPTEPLLAGFHSPEDSFGVLHLPVIAQGADSLISLIDRLVGDPALATSDHPDANRGGIHHG
jgi:Iap family predicted aminopeptidase